MNREILFKGKRADNGEWIEGYLFDDGLPKPKRFFVGEFGIYEYEGVSGQWAINRQDIAEVDPDTICQYTGQKTMNDVRIWENDIVQIGWYKGVVKYEEGCFVIKWGNIKWIRKDIAYWISLGDFNTIGNIFDNPGLLEKSEETSNDKDIEVGSEP